MWQGIIERFIVESICNRINNDVATKTVPLAKDVDTINEIAGTIREIVECSVAGNVAPLLSDNNRQSEATLQLQIETIYQRAFAYLETLSEKEYNMAVNSLIFRIDKDDNQALKSVEKGSGEIVLHRIQDKLNVLDHNIGHTLDVLHNHSLQPTEIAVDLLLLACAVYAADKQTPRLLEGFSYLLSKLRDSTSGYNPGNLLKFSITAVIGSNLFRTFPWMATTTASQNSSLTMRKSFSEVHKRQSKVFSSSSG